MSLPEDGLVHLLGFRYLPGRRMPGAFFWFLALRDCALWLLLSVSPRPIPKLCEVRTICVCKPDHLGDLLMAGPVLRRLREAAPQAEIVLVVGQWCAPLASFLRDRGIVDVVVYCNLAALDRGRLSPVRKIFRAFVTRMRAVRDLRRRKVDLFLDLRPFSPNAWSIGWMAGARYRVGFGLRGMAYTYHRQIPFHFERTFGQLFLDGVDGLDGGLTVYRGPFLPSAGDGAARKLPAELTGYVVVQLFSVEAQRNVPEEFWQRTIELIAREFPIVLVGSSTDAGTVSPELLAIPRVTSLIGQTSIPELLRLVEESAGVASVDSFVAHVGLAYAKPVAVLTVSGVSMKRSFPAECGHLLFFSSESSRPEEVAESFCDARI